jgi:hypothetical protein
MLEGVLPIFGLLAIIVLWLVPSKFLGAGTYGFAFSAATIVHVGTAANAVTDWRTWAFAAVAIGCLAYWARGQLKNEHDERCRSAGDF